MLCLVILYSEFTNLQVKTLIVDLMDFNWQNLVTDLVARVETGTPLPPPHWESPGSRCSRKGLAEAKNPFEDQVWAVLAVAKMWNCLAAFLASKVPRLEVMTRLVKIHTRRIRLLKNCLKAEQKKGGDSVRDIVGVLMELLEVKQKKFERTAGALEPRLLQKLAHLCLTGANLCKTYLDTLPNVDGGSGDFVIPFYNMEGGC